MKLKNFLLAVMVLTITFPGLTQVSISHDQTPPDESAMLDIKSTDKGILVPRMSTVQRIAISNMATGLLVFDNDTASW